MLRFSRPEPRQTPLGTANKEDFHMRPQKCHAPRTRQAPNILPDNAGVKFDEKMRAKNAELGHHRPRNLPSPDIGQRICFITKSNDYGAASHSSTRTIPSSSCSVSRRMRTTRIGS